MVWAIAVYSVNSMDIIQTVDGGFCISVVTGYEIMVKKTIIHSQSNQIFDCPSFFSSAWYTLTN